MHVYTSILWVLLSLPHTLALLSPQATEILSLPSLLPAILLSILFFPSTAYIENISKGKYSTAYTAYTAYQKLVPMVGRLFGSLIHGASYYAGNCPFGIVLAVVG